MCNAHRPVGVAARLTLPLHDAAEGRCASNEGGLFRRIVPTSSVASPGGHKRKSGACSPLSGSDGVRPARSRVPRHTVAICPSETRTGVPSCGWLKSSRIPTRPQSSTPPRDCRSRADLLHGGARGGASSRGLHGTTTSKMTAMPLANRTHTCSLPLRRSTAPDAVISSCACTLVASGSLRRRGGSCHQSFAPPVYLEINTWLVEYRRLV